MESRRLQPWSVTAFGSAHWKGVLHNFKMFGLAPHMFFTVGTLEFHLEATCSFVVLNDCSSAAVQIAPLLQAFDKHQAADGNVA